MPMRTNDKIINLISELTLKGERSAAIAAAVAAQFKIKFTRNSVIGLWHRGKIPGYTKRPIIRLKKPIKAVRLKKAPKLTKIPVNPIPALPIENIDDGIPMFSDEPCGCRWVLGSAEVKYRGKTVRSPIFCGKEQAPWCAGHRVRVEKPRAKHKAKALDPV